MLNLKNALRSFLKILDFFSMKNNAIRKRLGATRLKYCKEAKMNILEKISPKRPIVLIIPDFLKEESRCSFMTRCRYVESCTKTGLLPITISYALQSNIVSQYLEMADGLLILGGGFAIDPQYFNQPNTGKLPLNPERTAVEMTYFKESFKKKLPILGICGGMQLINVALGGSLIQHLPDHEGYLNHSPSPIHKAHEINIASESFLFEMTQLKQDITNSSHVQAVDQLGGGLRACAFAPDGVIEAIEHKEHPFCLGTQWHPEVWDSKVDFAVWDRFSEECQKYFFHKHLLSQQNEI